jgi:ketosteroid isomerase-like protein
MSEQDNRALVQRGYDAFGRGDIEALLALLDENVEWITPGPSDLPTAGRRRGRQQVAEFFKGVDSLFEIQRFEPESFVSEGDRVVVLGSETTRVKATGKVLEMRWVHAFTVRNGKVVVLEEFQDTAAVVAELRDVQART